MQNQYFDILQNTLNGMGALAYISDPDTDEIMFISDRMRGVFTIDDACTGKKCWEILQTGMNERCPFCPIPTLKERPGEQVVWREFNSVTKRHYQNTDSLMPWHDGALVHIQNSIDVTDLVNAEQKATEQRAQQELLAALVNSSPSYISYVRGEQFEFISPSACEISGYSHEELMREGPKILYSPETAEKIQNELVPNARRQGNYKLELPLLRKDGAERILSFHCFTVDSDPNGHATIAEDVTDLKRIERELIAAKESADKANRAKSEFLSRMSHEMRTPLNAILGMTNIATTSNDAERQKYCLGKIENASNHLLGIINDILDMTKIEADRLKLTHEQFDLEAMLDQVLSMTNHTAEKKNQRIEVEIDKRVPKVIASDKVHLSQILSNLLSNAMKFSPPCSTIRVKISRAGNDLPNRPITLFFEVIDEGIGISPEGQKNLFRSFEQLDGGLSRKYGGTGLGLAISKNLVELMGGRISVKSELGRGSNFGFTIVTANPAQAAAVFSGPKGLSENMIDIAPEEALNRIAAKHILLVEDLEINREIIAAFFEETGLQLEFAFDGAEAIRMYEGNPDKYDLIFMDIQMPNVDGYEATRAIRKSAHKNAQEIPIVALTANVFQEDIDRCLAAGMNDHIGKPVNKKELMKKTVHYLEKRHA